jgi:cbb3-type cytochrome oxidase maturation protein
VDVLLYLIPAALVLGLIGLGAFLWALRTGQFDDLDGAAERILFDEDDDEDEEPPPVRDEPTDPSKER